MNTRQERRVPGSPQAGSDSAPDGGRAPVHRVVHPRKLDCHHCPDSLDWSTGGSGPLVAAEERSPNHSEVLPLDPFQGFDPVS